MNLKKLFIILASILGVISLIGAFAGYPAQLVITGICVGVVILLSDKKSN